MVSRIFLMLGIVLGLSACARQDLSEPPMPLGDFVLGHNIVVTDNMQKVPISRDATAEEWKAAVTKAIDDRLGQARYSGSKVYNLGISVDAYALAPPGIPVVAAPKSALVITANIWDDAAQKKLNEEGEQIMVFEDFSGATVIGSGLTRSREEQIEILAFNAARKVEAWLTEHPEWFDMTPEQMKAALAARGQALSKSSGAGPEADAAEGAGQAAAASTPEPAAG